MRIFIFCGHFTVGFYLLGVDTRWHLHYILTNKEEFLGAMAGTTSGTTVTNGTSGTTANMNTYHGDDLNKYKPNLALHNETENGTLPVGHPEWVNIDVCFMQNIYGQYLASISFLYLH